MSIKIDKSVFTPEELDTYKALIAKATVDVEAAEEEMSEERPDFPPKKKRVEFEEEEVETEKCNTRKSADPQLTAAMERLETLEKSIALQEMTEIAKKYTAYIAVLEKSLGLVEKSGIFAEIGKSSGAYSAAAGAVGKVEAIASDIMKSDTSMTREQAIAKAWEDHPELIAEYDREYRR